jgi:hypothetical protein
LDRLEADISKLKEKIRTKENETRKPKIGKNIISDEHGWTGSTETAKNHPYKNAES